MKKIIFGFIAMMVILTGCSSSIDVGIATFKLPRQFKLLESSDYELIYTDSSNDKYSGVVTIGTYVNSEDYESFEDFLAFVKDEGILSYAESLTEEEGSHSVVNQRDIDLDGKVGYKTMIISEEDQFKVEMIHIPVEYDDGDSGFVQVIFEYHSQTYPDLAEDFMNSYKWANDLSFE